MCMKQCPEADSDFSSVGIVLDGSSPMNFTLGIRISHLRIYYRIKCVIIVCLNEGIACFSVLQVFPMRGNLLKCYGLYAF